MFHNFFALSVYAKKSFLHFAERFGKAKNKQTTKTAVNFCTQFLCSKMCCGKPRNVLLQQQQQQQQKGKEKWIAEWKNQEKSTEQFLLRNCTLICILNFIASVVQAVLTKTHQNHA